MVATTAGLEEVSLQLEAWEQPEQRLEEPDSNSTSIVSPSFNSSLIAVSSGAMLLPLTVKRKCEVGCSMRLHYASISL